MRRTLDLMLPGDPATLTGGYVYDRRVVEGLESLGWTVRVLRLGDDFPGASPASLRAADDVLASIPAGRTVVVDGLALADLAATLERHAARLGIVALVHHPVGDETGLDESAAARLRRDERRAWQAARGVIVTSRWTARRVAADRFPSERIRIVEPGTDRPAPGGGGRGDEHGRLSAAPHASMPDPPRLLCVATLTPRKGHAVLLDALARLTDLPWRLDCVGSTARDPATAAALRARIASLGLAARVVLHGEVSRGVLDALHRAAHAFVLPSFLEGYGIAHADALAYGLPIVATEAGAVPDTVGDAGLLVPPGDVDALADALARVLGDAALHAALSARALERARALPTWADAAARFAAAVEALAGTGGSGA
ncbi:MAG TPA: glycosyltransferase family 4 protein [Gammaproteobacteria bacterium]